MRTFRSVLAETVEGGGSCARCACQKSKGELGVNRDRAAWSEKRFINAIDGKAD